MLCGVVSTWNVQVMQDKIDSLVFLRCVRYVFTFKYREIVKETVRGTVKETLKNTECVVMEDYYHLI